MRRLDWLRGKRRQTDAPAEPAPLEPTPAPIAAPAPLAAQIKRWPKKTAAPPSVPVYYAGGGFAPQHIAAIQRAIAIWNEAGAVNLIDMGDSVSERPAGQNFYTIVATMLPGMLGGFLTTGVGGFYPGQDTTVQYIRGCAIWCLPDIDTYAAQIASMRQNALGPDLVGIGWSAQDVLNMFFAHEMGHALGLPETTDPLTPSCFNGNRDRPSAVDLALLALSYAAADGWDWPDGPPGYVDPQSAGQP